MSEKKQILERIEKEYMQGIEKYHAEKQEQVSQLTRDIVEEYVKNIANEALKDFLKEVEYCNKACKKEVEWVECYMVKKEKLDTQNDYDKMQDEVNQNIKPMIENDFKKCLNFISAPNIEVELKVYNIHGFVCWMLSIQISYSYEEVVVMDYSICNI